MVDVHGGPVKKFLVKQFLPLGFVVGVIWALTLPAWGSFLYEWQSNGWKVMTTINLSIIFFIFGITLETKELKDAFKAYKTLCLAIVSIMFITALTGFIFINMDFQPKEFGYGLAIFACAPTSLSSGVTLVIQGYGNAALALLMTVLTNIIGIFISPLMVKIILASSIKNIKVDAVDLLIKLGVSIIVPLTAGKALRELYAPALRFAKKYKVPLYLFNNFQIVMIVWQTLSHSRDVLLAQKFYDVLFAIMGAIGQHFFFLVLNTAIAWLTPFIGLRMIEAERKAYIIMASQKSLPTAAVIISYLPSGTGGASSGEHHGRRLFNDNEDPATGTGGLGDLGLVAIPCIVFYVMQLFIDSFIASGWASKYEKGQALQDKYADQLAELAKLDPDAPSLMDGTKGVDGGAAGGADGSGSGATAYNKDVVSGEAKVEMTAEAPGGYKAAADEDEDDDAKGGDRVGLLSGLPSHTAEPPSAGAELSGGGGSSSAAKESDKVGLLSDTQLSSSASKPGGGL